MITIKIPKDPLTASILDVETEKLYISLTNELLRYAKCLTKKSFNTQKREMILFKLSSSDIGGVSEEFLARLEEQKNELINQDTILSSQMNDILTRLLDILSKLKEKDTSKEVYVNNVGGAINYSEEEKKAIETFVKLRRKSYEIVEYIGAYFVKKEVPKDKASRELFAIAIDSLKAFDIDQILNSQNIGEITDLMNIILGLFTNRIVNTKDLNKVSKTLKLPEYTPLIERLQNSSNIFLAKAIK